MSNNTIDFIRSGILNWGRDNYRYYPWRETDDPYKIIIAEILLQRTKANQVLIIYDHFISKYPNMSKICSSPLCDLYKTLQSLGLRWRIRNLRKTACIIVNEYNNVIPKTKVNLVKLPGIGDYIAGAFLCSAYNKKTPLLDVNIVRVLSKIFGYPLNDSSRRSKLYYSKMHELMPDKSPREFLYALLDFAHSICTIKTPSCVTCVIKCWCVSFKQHNLIK